MAAQTVSSGLIGDPGLGGVTREQYAVDFLTGIGAPITASNIAAMEIWMVRESGSSKTGFAFNPLNSTSTKYGSAGEGGSQGDIQIYANYEQGLETVVNQIQSSSNGYPAIVNAFRSDAGTVAIFNAINASKWGTHDWTSTDLSKNQTADVTNTAPSATLADIKIGPVTIPAPGPNINLTPGLNGNPITGATDAISALGTIAAQFAGIFTNWRYELELLIGGVMILIGVRLVIADTTGAKVIPRPSPATTAAVAGAAAA